MAFNSSSGEATFGAVIENRAPNNEHSPSSTQLLTPFYQVPSAQPSLQSIPSKQGPIINVYDTDLEALNSSDSNPTPSQSALDLSSVRPVPTTATTVSNFKGAKECTMWPTKETLKEKAKAQKTKEQERKWGGSLKLKWNNMSKKQRLYIKALVFLLVVALAVGLGVGISKAVNGGVYAGEGQTHSIQGS